MIVGQESGQSFPLAHVGYAGVSTLDQEPTLQHEALTEAGCTKIFEDRASGAPRRSARSPEGAGLCA